jgi:hypothetical protein
MAKKKYSPKAFDIASWRSLTTKEVLDWLKSLESLYEDAKEMQSGRKKKSRKRRRGSRLIIRTHLTPLDVYCYLKARFGEPNGFQNFLRRDDSDNLIHWEYQVEAHGVNMHIMGSDRQIHFWVGEILTDEQWKQLILIIKDDYKRVGPEKSRVLRGLEKWVVFPNKYVQIAGVCAELYADICDNIHGFKSYKPTSARRITDSKAQSALAKTLGARANNLYGNCIQLALLTPILAEAFINLLILVLCKPETRNDKTAFDQFVRSHIHTRIFGLSEHCIGFANALDENTSGFKEFKRIMDRRNHAIHGNIDPIRERLETVYFQGKVPIFTETGDHIGRYFDAMERQYAPQRVIDDYINTHSFLIEIMRNLEPTIGYQIWRVLEDPYPGYDARRQRTGILFPNYVVSGYLGLRYDDELEVEWG